MNDMNLNEMTVIELRKVAKEMKVPLGAGISKQGIIDKLTAAMAEQAAPAAEAAPAAPAEEAPPAEEKSPEEDKAPAVEPAPEPKKEEPAPEAPAQPQFKQAYVAPQRFGTKPAFQQGYGRPTSRSAAPADAPRPQTTRPTGFQSRFGPAAQTPPAAPAAHQEAWNDEERTYSSVRTQADAGRFQRPQYEAPRPVERSQHEQSRPNFERPQYEQTRQNYEQRPAYQPRQNINQESAPFSVNPTATEIMQAVDCPEIGGVLELLPEGYGFLRGDNLVTSNRDVYVAQAQIRRFGLRTGDRILGRVRPLRDGDKYPALLTVTQVNGLAPDAAANRPNFDSLTPIYPTRRIQLERKEAPQLSDLRMMDLITPIGFGQRGLIQCGPNTGKARLLTRLANVISANHPEAEVMMLLFNETPENVTLIRESVKCQVIASTFDMAPEAHLRMADLIIERAQRLVELKKDVVILVDSLTTLIRVISTAAMQAGRAIPGAINPQSLQKAKRLFGAARCIREGGSLTVIATMNTDSGTKADDSVVNDFRGAANMELVLDQALARAGVLPPFDLSRCGTKRAEAILTPAHVEGLKLLRGMLGRLPAENALREIASMMEKTATNEELLSRIKVWAESMKA